MQQAQQGLQGQGQLAPQGWFGNAISSFGRPLGGLIGGLAGNQQLGSTIGGIASQLGGMLPFSAGPQQQQQVHPLQQQQQQQQLLQQLQQLQQLHQFVQQQLQALQGQQGQQAGQGQGQFAPQGLIGNTIAQFGQPVGSYIGGQLGNQQLGSTIGGIAAQLGSMLPFSADPYQMQRLAQQQSQQGQLAPQGWFGNAISSFGRPLGGLIGGLAGNQQLGSTIGGIASQLGGMLPFSADPYQQQLQQLQQLQQHLQQQQQGQQAQPGQFPIYTTPSTQGYTVH